jgi:hypothetical protein
VATEELFLQTGLDSVISLAETEVPAGVCQILAGLDLYDLKPLQSIGTSGAPEGTPAAIGNNFLFRTCGPAWAMTIPYLQKA